MEVENLDEKLKKLVKTMPEVKAAMLVSTEGFPIAAALSRSIDRIQMAGMTAALLSLAERSIIEMAKGKFEQLFIRGKNGYILVLQTGPNVVLAISTTHKVKLRLIIHDIKENFSEFGTYTPLVPFIELDSSDFNDNIEKK
ncbi:MAG: roadblock/LC7 domain-containing protein [Candidatus Hermodarchaeota archaeon]